MKKTTEAIRLITAVLLGVSAGVSVAVNVLGLARAVAADRRDGVDEEIRRVLRETTQREDH